MQVRLSDAEKYVQQGLKSDATDYTCLFSLARILMALNRPQEALRYNKAALEQWSDDALTNAQYGLNLLLLGDKDGAAQYLGLARRIDPENLNNPQFWSELSPLRKSGSSR